MFWAVINLSSDKKTQSKHTFMHTEVLLCWQITAVLQVKIVVPVRSWPHQEAEPGGRQEVTHSHCPSLLLDRQREDQGKYKTKTRSATSYTEPNKLPAFINIIACNFMYSFSP